MPAEAAADVVDIAHCLDMVTDGFVADTQRHARLFGADFVVFLDIHRVGYTVSAQTAKGGR